VLISTYYQENVKKSIEVVVMDSFLAMWVARNRRRGFMVLAGLRGNHVFEGFLGEISALRTELPPWGRWSGYLTHCELRVKTLASRSP
jgi:hypothetical protein